MTSSSAVSAPSVPPFGRDRMVHGWFVVKGISDAGDTAWTIALAWTAVQLAGPVVAGLVVAAGTVPRALVLLVGGVVADRYPVRRILVVTTVARVLVLVAAMAVGLPAGESVPLLVGVAVAFGLCDAVFEPAASTLGRQLVREHDLAAYAGAGQTAARLGVMAGAAAGGGLVALGGLPASAGVNAVTYLAVLGYLARVLHVRFPLRRAEPVAVGRAIAAGFGHLRSEATTRTLVLTLSGLNLAVGPALGLGLALRVRGEAWGAETLGVLQALVGLGALCGAVVLIRWRPQRRSVLGFALLVVQGLAVVLLAMPAVHVAALACLLIGLTAGSASALLGAVFVGSVAPEFLGRLASMQRMGDDVLMPLAMATFGVVAGGVSVAAAFAVFGGLMAALMLAALLRPSVRSLDRRAQGCAPAHTAELPQS